MFFTRPSSPTLRIIAPTPTTVSFTVSTRPPETIPTLILYYITLAVRAIIASSICVILLATWRALFPLANHERSDIESLVLAGSVGSIAFGIVERVDWRLLLPACAVGLWGAVRRGYTEESLLVIRDLGVQTSSSAPTYLSSSVTRFIPTTSIQDMFINEAFRGFEVRYYLSIVVKGEEDAVVVFPRLLPRRQILEDVWRGARTTLYETHD